jgi:hypothetical protein
MPNKTLTKMREKIAKKQQELAAAVADEQCVCKHEHVAEADYVSSPYGRGMPPMRVCLDCGLSEDGWSFYVLTAKPTRMDRSEVYRNRLGFMLHGHHQGPLLRKEVTVAQLVRGEVNVEMGDD